jgi:hypothetical protein
MTRKSPTTGERLSPHNRVRNLRREPKEDREWRITIVLIGIIVGLLALMLAELIFRYL